MRCAAGSPRSSAGCIVCGPRDEEDGFAEAITALSHATGYPVIAEATSQARYGGRRGDAVHV